MLGWETFPHRFAPPNPAPPFTLLWQEEVTRLSEQLPEASGQRLPVVQPKSFSDPKKVPLPEEEVQILELNAQGGLWQSEAFQEDLQATWPENTNFSKPRELDGFFVFFGWCGFLVVDCFGGLIGLLIGNCFGCEVGDILQF